MSVRKVVTASVAALALAAASSPIVNAQEEGPGSGALSSEGLVSGSLESVGSEGDETSSVIPETGEVCDLPGLGGSVAKFYPLFGITGIPTSMINLVTGALDSFPNLLELVAGEGAGEALLGQAGSLNEGLCTAIFGGDMVMPPVTVIVDGDGNPVTTVTGTIAPAPSTPTTTLVSSSSQESDTTPPTTDGASEGEAGEGARAAAATAPLPTSVPVG